MTKRLPAQRYYRIATSVFFFVQGITFASWANRIPTIKGMLQLNDASLGALLFALPAGQILGLPVAGYLVSRYGSRKTLIAGALLYPATLMLLGLVTAVWQLALALALFGFFVNLMNISVNTQAVGIEKLYRRSIMASFHGLWSLGGFMGGLVSTSMIAKNISPFTHFVFIWAFTLLCLIVFYRYLLPRDESHESQQPIFVKPDKYILNLGLIALASMVSEGAMFDWSGVYFEKVVMAPKALITLGYIAFMSTMAGGRFTADYFVTKFGVKNVLQTSGVIIAVGLLLSILFPYIVPATIGFLMVGIGVSSIVPLVYGLAGRSKTMRPGVALAAVSSIGFLGFLFGPPFIGFIAQIASLRWSFAVIGLLGLSATFLSRNIK